MGRSPTDKQRNIYGHRSALTPNRKARIWAREGGICWYCGVSVDLDGQGVIYDHRDPLWISGKDDDANLFPIHAAPCNRLKTSKDLKAIAKVRRLLKKAQKKPPGPTRSPKRRIKSRGFDKTVKRRLDGRVCRPEDR